LHELLEHHYRDCRANGNHNDRNCSHNHVNVNVNSSSNRDYHYVYYNGGNKCDLCTGQDTSYNNYHYRSHHVDFYCVKVHDFNYDSNCDYLCA